MFGGLNNDWVLLGSIGAIAVSTVVLIVWAWKTFLSMEGNGGSE